MVEADDVARTQVVDLIRGSCAVAVHAFARVSDALQLLESQRVNLLVLPFDSESGDGLTLLDQIRARDPLIHVIMTSRAPTLGQAVLSLQHGAVDFLCSPPVAAEEFVEAIAQSVIRWRRWSDIIRRIASLNRTAHANP